MITLFAINIKLRRIRAIFRPFERCNVANEIRKLRSHRVGIQVNGIDLDSIALKSRDIVLMHLAAPYNAGLPQQL